MANEASVRSGLEITKGNLKYRSFPNEFRADVTGSKGPLPGAVTVTTGGTDIDLTGLGTPGFCRLGNIDSTNFVEYGIWNGANFYPLGEIGPGECYTIKIARNFADNLRVRANTASCVVVIEAFEK